MESLETLSYLEIAEQDATETLINRAFQLGAIQVREEITGFVRFLRGRKLRNVMEIGSESGGTFYLWCRLAALGGIKISLDKPDGDSGSWRFKESGPLAERTKLFQSFAPRVKVVTGDSHSPAVKWGISHILGAEKLDLLFIDGDHSYEGVKQDFEMYREFVAPGGLIAFHDILDTEHHRIRGCHVSKLWQELQGHKIEFNAKTHLGGIGVLTV